MHLPPELIVHVLSYLSLSCKDLASVSQVNRVLWQVAQDDALWAACVNNSKLCIWWDLADMKEKTENEKSGKRKATGGSSHKQFMKEWTRKTFSWIGSAATKDINALILGDPTYSEDFLDWLSVGSLGNKRAAITFSIEATILRLKSQVGSLGKAIVLNQFGHYSGDGETVDVVLIHYSDTSTLYCAYMIAQNAKKSYPNSAFVVTGDPTCSPTLLEELITVLDAKAFIPMNYRSPVNATTCDSLYSLVLAHGARAAIRNTSLHAIPMATVTQPPAKKPKPCEETAEHTEIKCDGCGMFPLIGTRHVCTTCKRVDLCATCLTQKATVRRGRCARHTFRQIRKFAVEEEGAKKEGESVLEKAGPPTKRNSRRLQ
eukprot:Phypoly_transcript_09888.p1 GENE.Phypoly_transcript_09888~~Phypoly_transcript_09888.p1  ORF type:complete len:373 (+),score=57.58 Phypoly_transcript_09888:159-1277(+)